MTPRLLLNSTKPKDYAKRSHGVSAANPPQTDVGDQCHAATYQASGGGAHGPVGRPPASGANHPQLLGVGLVWAWPGLNTEVELVLSDLASVLGLHLVHLSLN